jgi:diaminopimelate decarboxylase
MATGNERAVNEPAHAALARVVVDGDCMVFAGRRLTDLVTEVGATPFYAYDRQAISERVRELRRHLPLDVHIHYAMKANPMPAVVAHLAPLVDGLDVASAGELEIALASGAEPASISFAGPGKTARDHECALAAGVIVNVESAGELRRFAALAEASGRRGKVAIRVNPDFELKSSGMRMGGGPKQFGVDAEQVPDLLANLPVTALDFMGFHIFSGSQNLNAEAIIEAQTKTIDLAVRLAAFAPRPVHTVNIGGGFGIPYFPNDAPLDLATIGVHLHALLEKGRRLLPDARIVLELGRYLVGEAGIYVCRVIDRKVSRGQTFLVTDGGLHHHLAASGNFGQVLRKNYPILIGNKLSGREREKVSIVGPLCTPLDLLGDRVEVATAEEGDLVVVLQSGAYGFTASPLGFLSHPPPAEVLL